MQDQENISGIASIFSLQDCTKFFYNKLQWTIYLLKDTKDC